MRLAIEDRSDAGKASAQAAYDQFLASREAALLVKIREVCGVLPS